jgi:hypothetical protein
MPVVIATIGQSSFASPTLETELVDGVGISIDNV